LGASIVPIGGSGPPLGRECDRPGGLVAARIETRALSEAE
jgi:hypothetical protein